MKRAQVVEILAEESNFVVIKVPSRKYPGVLIQGDSLYGIVGTLATAIELFETDKEEAMEALKEAYDELSWRTEGYQKVMEENNSPFSYQRDKPF